MAHPSNSEVQQAVEDEVRTWLSSQTKLTYTSERVQCGEEFVEVDAVGRDGDRIVELVEIYARQGKLKGGQLKKPTDDAARLMLAAKHVKGKPKAASRLVQRRGGRAGSQWLARKRSEAMGVEMIFVPLNAATVKKVRSAQTRQRR